MPPWFDHWYRQQLLTVHQKLKDPEESGFWLDDLLKKTGPPPSDSTSWKQQIEEVIGGLPTPDEDDELPEGWETLSQSDQNAIKQAFSGISPLQQIEEGEALEKLLSSLFSGKSLAGEKALWMWQYLLGRIGMAEENLMRHWVDAEEENLQAFEERYELHDQIRRIPGTIFIDTVSAWNACYPDIQVTTPKKPLSKRAKILIVAAMVVSMIAGFSAVVWVNESEGETVRLSESLTAQMLDGKSPILMERNQLTFSGMVELMVEVKDSIRMLGGLVIFDPGVYLVELENDRKGEFLIESGHLKAFLGEEIFVLEEGMRLKNQSGVWLKEWE